MSWQATVWALDVPLPPCRKLVLLALAARARDDGSEARPRVATIAKQTGLAERTVRRELAALRAAGLIAETAPAHAGKKWPATYRLEMAATPDCVAPLDPCQSDTPDCVAGVGVTHRPQTPDCESPTKVHTSIQEYQSRESASAPPPTRAGKGSRLSLTDLPDDWACWAHDQGHPSPARAWERFADYWTAQPGARGVRADWLATWRNWIRKDLDQQQPRGGTARQQTGGQIDRMDAVAEVFDALRRSEGRST